MKLGRQEEERLELIRTCLEGVTDAIDAAEDEGSIEVSELRAMVRLTNKAETHLRTLCGD